jgi:copper chaperone CopZ
MTCAHVVHVALKKVSGVESVEVSLNKGLATVKLNVGNAVSVPQLWEIIHQNGYTPKATAVSVRGNVTEVQGRLSLKVSETSDTLALVPGPKNAAAFDAAKAKLGQTVVVDGVMNPGKDLKAPVPLQVNQVK